MSGKAIIISLAIFSLSALSTAQNSNSRALLPLKVLDELTGEASGETALNHIIEMGAYNHNRPAAEYSGDFFETEYVIKTLEGYNVKGLKVYHYPGGSYWDGIKGELWETSPNLSKIADYDDLTAMLAQGSRNCDISAQLVWVGEGSTGELEEKNIKGKIVFTSGSPRMVHDRAVKKGALGVVSYYSPRPLKVPLAIPVTGISGRDTRGDETFAFMLPPREGEILRDRLLSGEEITVHAVVESQILDYDLEIPSCYIEGTDPDAGEVILSAHLFEGYVKQGANDNISGSAAILEVARMLQTLIDEGRIEKPLRNIRFIWVPEYSGTIPWVNDNRAITNRTLCNINLDMVGLNLARSGSFLTLQRTTFGNPHYINDIMQNYFEYVGITNREGLAVSGRGGFTRRIVAPSGTDDPFYFQVDDHYGSSDHEVFNDPAIGVPGIMMITWPDLFYHTSQDRADKCDPTELKRACVIAAAGAYTVASADKKMAMKIAGEIIANGSSRIGQQLARATELVSNAGNKNFNAACNLGRSYIIAATLNEKATLFSVSELDESMKNYLSEGGKLIDEIGSSAIDALDLYIKHAAGERDIKTENDSPGRLVIQASEMIPVATEKVTNGEYGISRQMAAGISSYRERYPVSGMMDITEFIRLCNGSNNLLEIKMLMDTQLKNGETDLESLISLVNIFKEGGYITL